MCYSLKTYHKGTGCLRWIINKPEYHLSSRQDDFSIECRTVKYTHSFLRETAMSFSSLLIRFSPPSFLPAIQLSNTTGYAKPRGPHTKNANDNIHRNSLRTAKTTTPQENEDIAKQNIIRCVIALLLIKIIRSNGNRGRKQTFTAKWSNIILPLKKGMYPKM